MISGAVGRLDRPHRLDPPSLLVGEWRSFYDFVGDVGHGLRWVAAIGPRDAADRGCPSRASGAELMGVRSLRQRCSVFLRQWSTRARRWRSRSRFAWRRSRARAPTAGVAIAAVVPPGLVDGLGNGLGQARTDRPPVGRSSPSPTAMMATGDHRQGCRRGRYSVRLGRVLNVLPAHGSQQRAASERIRGLTTQVRVLQAR